MEEHRVDIRETVRLRLRVPRRLRPDRQRVRHDV